MSATMFSLCMESQDPADSLAGPAADSQQNIMLGEGVLCDKSFQALQQDIANLSAWKGDLNGNDHQCYLHRSPVAPGSAEFESDKQDVADLEVFGQGDGNFDLSPLMITQPLKGSAAALQPFIADAWDSGVSYHHGQLTPPDDISPEWMQEAQQPGQTNSKASALSERARNAAKHRHAKPKKSRKDSVHMPTDEARNSKAAEDKRETNQEKNRVAAAKCRAKKKSNTEDLEGRARFVTAENTRLRAEQRELRNIFSSLRHRALAHDPTQGCRCTSIHMYNNGKAQEAARGATEGLAAYDREAMPSFSSKKGNSSQSR